MSRHRQGVPLQSGRRRATGPSPRRRLTVVMSLFGLVSLALAARAFDVQVIRKEFYQEQGDARFLREVPIAVSRGSIFDRNGEPLAVSTPMVSITAVPAKVLENDEQLPQLAAALGTQPDELRQYLEKRANREFAYLKRQMSPEQAKVVLDLAIPGINGQREFRRYYPSGEVTAHVLGFTNIDDHGQEGLELAFDDWLSGKPGKKRVIRDNKGHIVEDVEQVSEPTPGRNLTISIDRRIQFLAYSELKAAVEKSQADSGTMVILDVKTGEVLAMVNIPTFNPNAVGASEVSARRNRAVTDVFEPGSTIKPILMAAALSSGKFTPTSPAIDTTGGHWYFGGHDIHDTHDYGVITPTQVITKSSNVGAAHIAMELDTALMYNTYRAFGFGNSTQSGFPGEASGHLRIGRDWRPLEQAILGYGYGLNATALQLATAYAALGNGGVLHRPTFIKGGRSETTAVVDPRVAREVVDMMETTTQPGGTAAPWAWIANYAVAAKTGTAHKAQGGGYAEDAYGAAFAGLVPATNPRLAAAVMIDNPKKGSYYGGLVSGPVFAKVMEGALRLLDIPPDNIGRWYVGGPMQGTNGLIGSERPDAPNIEEAPVDRVTP
ncbi:MAG TPA: penicillin-binding protein 2 [Dyella sp.]|nr:penicillin-binding protein 2 [Dyella sp.]